MHDEIKIHVGALKEDKLPLSCRSLVSFGLICHVDERERFGNLGNVNSEREAKVNLTWSTNK